MEKYPEEVYEDPNFCGTLKLYKYRNSWMGQTFFPDKEHVDRLLNLDIRPSDILLVSFPKSGTTWLQDIIWKVSCIKNSELVEREQVNGMKTTLDDRFPWLDGFPRDLNEIDQLPAPRFFKAHNQFHLLPNAAQNGTAKIVYVARDVRDVAVSFYHFIDFQTGLKYVGTAEDLCRNFLKGTVTYGPWLDHVREFWNRRNNSNILFVTYENMKKKPGEEILRVGQFLGVSLSQSQVDDIIGVTSFESMKGDDAVNFSWLQEIGQAKPDKTFMRKGVTGDWKNNISQEMGDVMQRELLEPLRQCGLSFGDS